MKELPGWPIVLPMISPHITASVARGHFDEAIFIELP